MQWSLSKPFLGVTEKSCKSWSNISCWQILLLKHLVPLDEGLNNKKLAAYVQLRSKMVR